MKNLRSETANAVTQWTNNEDGVIGALQQLETLGKSQGRVKARCSMAVAAESNVPLPTRPMFRCPLVVCLVIIRWSE
jgi:hypothetical protein